MQLNNYVFFFFFNWWTEIIQILTILNKKTKNKNKTKQKKKKQGAKDWPTVETTSPLLQSVHKDAAARGALLACLTFRVRPEGGAAVVEKKQQQTNKKPGPDSLVCNTTTQNSKGHFTNPPMVWLVTALLTHVMCESACVCVFE